MQFGVLAGNTDINSRIYRMLEQIDPEDIPAFVRKFRSEQNEQRFHTFRELIVGSHLRDHKLNARYGQVIHGKTPDWVIHGSRGDVKELVDVVSLHQRKETETDMLGTVSTGSVWAGWVTIPADHLYAKIQHKADAYAALSVELGRPYTVFLFGEFFASLDPDEVEYVLHEHHGGLFSSLPTLAGLAYFTESAGAYRYWYYANNTAKFSSPTIHSLAGGGPIAA